MRETIRLIGRSIRAGSRHLPTRNLAARYATRAGPKDYLGQAQSIYNNFLKRWRYVKDPVTREMVTASPNASFRLVMAGDGIGVGDGIGAGDCDCATVALGSLYESIGLPVRIATVAKPGSPPSRLMDHVFPEVKIPKLGWIPADPVLFPKKGFGAHPPASRKVVYDLDGGVVSSWGNLGSMEGTSMQPQIWNRAPMQTFPAYGLGQGPEQVEDFSPNFFGAADDGGQPEAWETVGLRNWGHLAPQMGATETGLNIPIEVGPDQQGLYGGDLVRTPMVELAPHDYSYISNNKRAYDGMMGLGDDGEVYVYDGLGGFFKRLFRKAKRAFKKVRRKIRKGIRRVVKGVRKVAKRIRRGVRKVIKRLPGGKALIKIGDKIRKVAMKVVRPVSKFVGKWAGKIAPIANFIPGYGPAISAGLRIAGRVAKGFNRLDALRRGKFRSAGRGLMRGRIPGLFGGADTPEAIEVRQALVEQLPRYVQ